MMSYLVDRYGQSADVTALLDETEFWVVPQINPDGVETVQQGITEDGTGSASNACQRKNLNPDASSSEDLVPSRSSRQRPTSAPEPATLVRRHGRARGARARAHRGRTADASTPPDAVANADGHDTRQRAGCREWGPVAPSGSGPPRTGDDQGTVAPSRVAATAERHP